jgi:hypothetical protein
MPNNRGKKALVITKDNLSSWPKAKALANTITKEITKFL